ncbi:hypothetical protein TUM4445_14330 [Shewanella sp. MBTL60-112-B2]|nr:hypothetical protein TUM4444_08350 [Shewanella sp. MBTL60-112-B1]GIU30681.1 hypothetical protein TUM4445_14330 [Shewanella sp. MBTL60-112-B2]
MPFLLSRPILSEIRYVHSIWFALARTVGWIAHWKEMLDQPGHKISRPRQLYTGDAKRDFVDLVKRD